MEVPEIPNLIYYAIPFFAVTIIFEGIFLYKKDRKNYNLKDAFASISMGIGNVIVNLVSKLLVVLIFTFIYENFKLIEIPFTWWAWIFILFVDDFCYYLAHRIGHESRFFWASHIVHHSSQKYNLSTALRQTWTGGFFTFIFYLALPFFGFHPLMIFTQMSVSLLYQYWIHTELIDKMPQWFEAFFNTPSHHRVHHGSNPIYLDRNHAGIFIIWDKLFGTFQPELKEEKVIYGLTSNIKTFNPLKIAFLEWGAVFKDAFTSKTSIFNKLKYFIKPPGWKHDGTGMLSNDLRKEWLKNKN
jgi:sterol desaturase/sphingolipid hydroxylase (fatty acid hydroxylase superfamily)